MQLDKNPRKISDAMKQKLADSLAKFNLVEIPAVNTNMQVIGGNQRVMALILADRGEEEIDVRFPSRELTAKEVKEYAIISNTHAGEFDFEILKSEFSDIDFTEIGFNIPNWSGVEINPDNFAEDFSLAGGDKAPFQQMTFILSDEQAGQIKKAIFDIKKTDEYQHCETMGNENSNGNALYLIIQQWVELKK